MTHRYWIDWNTFGHYGENTCPTMTKYSDAPAQTQLHPPAVGDVVIAEGGETAPPPVWATVVEIYSNGWMLLKLGESVGRLSGSQS